MNSKNKFEQFARLFKKAHAKKQQHKFQQAKNLYRQALKYFDPKQHDYTDYCSLLGQLGDIQRQQKLFIQSKNTYLRGIDLLNSLNNRRDVSQYDILKQKYHLYTNLALTLCAQAENIEDKKLNYSNFINLLDESFKNYKFCQKILVKMIIQRQKKKWWKEQYIALLNNICNSLVVESFEFKDLIIHERIVEIVEKAEKFYDLCKAEDLSDKQLIGLKEYLTISLNALERKAQCQKYFKKDYDFCSKQNDIENLKKTCRQMIFFYCNNFQFKDAMKYAQDSDQKIYITENQKMYNQLMKKIQDLQLNASKNEKINLDLLEETLLDINDKKMNKKMLEFNSNLRNCSYFRQNDRFRYFLEYFAAEASFKLKFYRQSIHYLNQASALAKEDEFEMIWCLLLKAKISQKVQNDFKKIEKIYVESLERSKIFGDQNQISAIQQDLEQFYLSQKRIGRKYDFETQQSKKLLQYMQKRSIRIQKQIQNQQKNYQNQIIRQDDEQIYEQKQKDRRLLKKNPFINYIEQCKILQIEPHPDIKLILSKNGQQKLNFQQFFNLPSSQLQAVLKSSYLNEQLDLRTTSMTCNLLTKIKQADFINGLKKLKLNLINGSIYYKSSENNKFYEEFINLVKHITYLDELSIVSCNNPEPIQKLISSSGSISSISSLVTLKLKECEIQDKHLIFWNFSQNLPQLKQLSLSHNLLEGSSLNCLSSLKYLESLNISSNPLRNVVATEQFPSLKFISLKFLQQRRINEQALVNLMSSEASKFINLILKCQKINFSYSSTFSFEIIKSLVNFLLENEISNNFLTSIKFIGVTLLLEDLQYLKKLKYLACKLKYLDLRNAHIKITDNHQLQSEAKDYLVEFQKQFNNNYQKYNYHQSSLEDIKNENKFFNVTNVKFLNNHDPWRKKDHKNFSVY